MKKVFLTFVMLVFSLILTAQITIFKGSLDEALAKANTEGKKVMLMGSGPYWRPCREIERDVIPSKRAGDYINSRFIFMKYDKPTDEYTYVTNKYGVVSIPTFIYLNSDGLHITNTVGGSGDIGRFINTIETALKYENTFAGKYEKAKKDSNFALEYGSYLIKRFKLCDKGIEFLDLYIDKSTASEIFTPENMKLFYICIQTVDSPILDLLIERKGDAIANIGEKEYLKFMQNQTNTLIVNAIRHNGFSKNNFNKSINFINKSDLLLTDYSKFLYKNKMIIGKRDYDALFKKITKVVESCNTETRKLITDMLINYLGSDIYMSKLKDMAVIYETAHKYEEDLARKKSYGSLAAGMKKVK